MTFADNFINALKTTDDFSKLYYSTDRSLTMPPINAQFDGAVKLLLDIIRTPENEDTINYQDLLNAITYLYALCAAVNNNINISKVFDRCQVFDMFERYYKSKTSTKPASSGRYPWVYDDHYEDGAWESEDVDTPQEVANDNGENG